MLCVTDLSLIFNNTNTHRGREGYTHHIPDKHPRKIFKTSNHFRLENLLRTNTRLSDWSPALSITRLLVWFTTRSNVIRLPECPTSRCWKALCSVGLSSQSLLVGMLVNWRWARPSLWLMQCFALRLSEFNFHLCDTDEPFASFSLSLSCVFFAKVQPDSTWPFFPGHYFLFLPLRSDKCYSDCCASSRISLCTQTALQFFFFFLSFCDPWLRLLLPKERPSALVSQFSHMISCKKNCNTSTSDECQSSGITTELVLLLL